MLGCFPLIAWHGTWLTGIVPVPDVPKNHWLFEGFSQAKKDGLLIGFYERTGHLPTFKIDFVCKFKFAVKSFARQADSLLAGRVIIASDGRSNRIVEISSKSFRADWDNFLKVR